MTRLRKGQVISREQPHLGAKRHKQVGGAGLKIGQEVQVALTLSCRLTMVFLLYLGVPEKEHQAPL